MRGNKEKGRGREEGKEGREEEGKGSRRGKEEEEGRGRERGEGRSYTVLAIEDKKASTHTWAYSCKHICRQARTHMFTYMHVHTCTPHQPSGYEWFIAIRCSLDLIHLSSGPTY